MLFAVLERKPKVPVNARGEVLHRGVTPIFLLSMAAIFRNSMNLYCIVPFLVRVFSSLFRQVFLWSGLEL